MNTRTWSSRETTFLIILILILFSLACGNGNVSPTEPALQPPTSNLGIRIEEFLAWIGLFPSDSLPPPWITVPSDKFSTVTERPFAVSGWAVNREDRPWPDDPERPPTVELWRVDTADDRADIVGLAMLSTTSVGDDRSWQISDMVVTEYTVLAAKVVVGETSSDFSNVIVVSLRPPAPLIVTSPLEGSETESDAIDIEGTGEPGLAVTVRLDGEKLTEQPAIIQSDGSWVLSSVQLELGENHLDISTDLIDLEAQRLSHLVYRAPLVRLQWPLRSLDTGELNCWYGPNDYHYVSYPPQHNGIDISNVAGEDVLAPAYGKITRVGKDTAGGYYVEIDHGNGYVTRFYHLSSEERADLGQVDQGEKIGRVTDGIEWCGASCSGPHVHMELTINGDPQNINPVHWRYRDHYSNKHIDLFDWWGQADFWVIDWTKVATNPSELSTDYNTSCMLKTSPGRDALAFRVRYCEKYPDECPCPR